MPTQDLTVLYARALQDSARGLSEKNLQQAYELGRRALSENVSPLDLTMIHQECLDWILSRADSAAECATKAKLAGVFFREILAPFEMAYRGYRELNAELERRGSELSELNERLQNDIADRKKLEIAKAAAEMANKAKSCFLASLSHELRTPLAAIIGYSQILVQTNDRRPLEEAQFIERILANGQDLLGQINNILDLARIEAGHMAVFSEPVDLNGLLKESIDKFELSSRAKGLSLRMEAPPGSSLVSTDSGKLRQILTNLVGNAIKFTHQGGVCLRLSQNREGLWQIDVEDTGIGIPKDKREAIFEPFVQADDGTNRRFGGTGLGLAICRSLAGLLGHRLALRSEPGQGSVFSLILGADTPAEGPPR